MAAHSDKPAMRSYRLPQDVEILNEIGTAVWFATYGPLNVKFLWCNKEAIKLWNKESLTDMVETDVFSNRSPAVKKLHEELYNIVQIKKEVNVCRRTMYPNGKAFTVDCEFAPIHVVHPDGLEETVAIVTAHPVENADAGKIESTRANEMLKHTPMLISMYTPEGAHIQSNISARSFYGGREIGGVMSLESVWNSCYWTEERGQALESAPPEFLAKLQAMCLGDSAVKLEVRKRPKFAPKEGEDPPTVWHEMNFVATADPGTGQAALLVIEIDITQLENMKLAEAQLIAAAKQKDQFFAAVSHELRTPLNGIIGLTEYLLEDHDEKEGDGAGESELNVILTSARHLNLLINDILDSASLDQGTIKLNFGPVDVNEIIHKVCAQLSVLCQNNVVLTPKHADGIPMANGDAQRVQQIITNLVGNSLKFTHHGTITVWVQCEPGADVLEVFVQDTGIGIALNQLEKVFQPFEQADMSAQRQYQGTGLGLSLVKQLVEGQGGIVSIDSKPSVGTTVSFTMHIFKPDHDGSASSPAFFAVVPKSTGATSLSHDGKDSSPRSLTPGPNPSSKSAKIKSVDDVAMVRNQQDNLRMEAKIQALVQENQRLSSILSSLTKDSLENAADQASVHAQIQNLRNAVSQQASSQSEAQQTLAPSLIAAQGIKREGIKVDDYPCVSVLVVEVVEQARGDERLGEEGWLNFINRLHTAFDEIVASNRGFPVDMLGEGYTVVTGHEKTDQSAAALLTMAEAFISVSKMVLLGMQSTGMHKGQVEFRMGICTGPSFATTVGTKTPRYIFFGQTVIDAIKIQRQAPNFCVLMCSQTRQQLQDSRFECKPWGNPEQQMYIAKIGNWEESVQGPVVSVHSGVVAICRESTSWDGRSYLRTLQMGVHKGNIIERGQTSLDGWAKLSTDKREFRGNESVEDLRKELFKLEAMLSEEQMVKLSALQELEESSTMLEDKMRESDALKKKCDSLKASAAAACAREEAKIKECKRFELEIMQMRRDSQPATRTSQGVDSFEDVLPINGTKKPKFRPPSGGALGSSSSDLDDSKAQSSSSGNDILLPSSPEQSRKAEELMSQAVQVLCHKELYGQVEILSIDDTPMNHLVIERILKRTGYKMTSCLNGVLALKLLEERGYLPDMVLLDVMMPHMSGHEVCQKIRELYPTSTVPIIMISAKSNQENILEGFSAGCIDYITKPFSRSELLARINAHIRLKDLFEKQQGSLQAVSQGTGESQISSANAGASPPRPLLPEHVRANSQTGGPIGVDTIPMATVLIADVVNYELLSSVMAAEDLFSTLNQLFEAVDAAAERQGLLRVEHEGDYVMLIGQGDSHAESCVQAGLEILEAVRMVRSGTVAARRLGLAIGLQSGPVYTCGRDNSRVEVPSTNFKNKNTQLVCFGPTVSEAFELESHGSSMTIAMGLATKQALDGKYKVEPWKWQQQYQRFTLVHDFCEWECALQSASETRVHAATGGVDENGKAGRTRLLRNNRKNKKILLELQLNTEREKAVRLEQDVAGLRAQCDALRLKMRENVEVPFQAKQLGQSRELFDAEERYQGATQQLKILNEKFQNLQEAYEDVVKQVKARRELPAEVEIRSPPDDDGLQALPAPTRRRRSITAMVEMLHESSETVSSSHLEQELRELRKERSMVGGELVAMLKECQMLRQERSDLQTRVRNLEMENASLASLTGGSLRTATPLAAGVLSPAERSSIVDEVRQGMVAKMSLMSPSAEYTGFSPSQQQQPGFSSGFLSGVQRRGDFRTAMSEGPLGGFQRSMDRSDSGWPTGQESSTGRYFSRDDESISIAGSTSAGGTLPLDRLGCIVTITDFASDSEETRATLTRALNRFGNMRQPLRMVRGRTGRYNAVGEMQTPEQAARVASELDNTTYNGSLVRVVVALPPGEV